MVKYWNSRRLHRARERHDHAIERAAQEARESADRERTFTPGNRQKNVRLMLEALGAPIHRKMIARLVKGGAMSLSKLCDPFGITLPAALKHLRVLERAGIVTTHKRGRIRFCIYNPAMLPELGKALTSKEVLINLD